MALYDDLVSDVTAIVQGAWSTTEGRVVPDQSSVTLGNTGKLIQAAVLYADLADSTILVDTYPAEFAAEVYKAFLICAAKLVRFTGGTITSYDGDRIMAVYMGDDKADRAVRAAQLINSAMRDVVRPALARQYPNFPYLARHVCGIDVSELLVAKTGARNDNDLVWVGRAANHAAKLAAEDDAWSTYVTMSAFLEMTDRVRYQHGSAALLDLWHPVLWSKMADAVIYRSTSFWDLTTPYP